MNRIQTDKQSFAEVKNEKKKKIPKMLKTFCPNFCGKENKRNRDLSTKSDPEMLFSVNKALWRRKKPIRFYKYFGDGCSSAISFGLGISENE